MNLSHKKKERTYMQYSPRTDQEKDPVRLSDADGQQSEPEGPTPRLPTEHSAQLSRPEELPRWTPRMYSRESGYAICALVRMATLAGYCMSKYLPMTQIVGGENKPRQYLAKTLQRLSREGILPSRKGPSGGFAFRLEHDKIDLHRISGAIDGGTPCFERCALGYATCSNEHPCAMHQSWKGVRECIRRYVKQTIAELAGTGSPDSRVYGEDRCRRQTDAAAIPYESGSD